MEHADSFRINIVITTMYRLTTRILDVSNDIKNTNVPIYESVCAIPPPYYIDWFEIHYPNVTLNQYSIPFCLQCVNVIQGGGDLENNGIGSLMQ